MSELPAGRLLLPDILVDEDYRHRLRLARGDAGAFFGPWDSSGALLRERRHWLGTAPQHHAPFLDDAAPLVDELVACSGDWRSAPTSAGSEGSRDQRPFDRWIDLSQSLEPDLVLLTRDAGRSRMVAGAVCFPSSWSPEEKIGKALGEIHDVVPGLNADIGSAIDTFLARLRPGATWLRANWGLCRSTELNQHPVRKLPRLGDATDLAMTRLRLEHQALLVLPRTGGIVFGIRVEQFPLTSLNGDESSALARALRSMPEAMAAYKGVAAVRESLADQLEGVKEV